MRGRLSLLVLAVTSMVVIAFLIPLALLIRSQASSRAIDEGQRTARSVAAGLAVASSISGSLDTSVVELVVATSGDGTATVFMGDGTAIGIQADRSAAVDLAASGRALTADTSDGVEVLVPVTAVDQVLVVRAFVHDDDLSRGVWPATIALAALGVVLIGAGVTLADRLGRNLVRPVADLAGAAHDMASGDLSVRVDPDGPPELEEVGAAFNLLAERVGDLILEERESLADLSHGLRTPLTALRLQAEMLPGPEAGPMLEDIDRLTLQVDALIDDARRSSPAAGPRTADLASIVRERCEFWSVLADEQGREHSARVPDRPVPVGLTAEELGTVVDTLLENVFAHTPPGTPYRVEVGDGRTLAVSDGGAGFPSEKVLLRGASGAGSTGLGLDIVRRAAERSGGGVTLGTAPGGGALIEAAFGPPQEA